MSGYENAVPPPIYTKGAEGAEITEADRLKMRAQQALYVLAEARRIRANAPLMAAIRAYVREQRDEMAVLLDEIG